MALETVSPLLRFIRKIRETHEALAKSDAALLHAFVTKRDEAAFTALVHRHGPMVLAVCRRMLWNFQDAEDAFQATFLVLVRKARSLAPSLPLAGWLYGVAYRTAQNARRLKARRFAKEAPLCDVQEFETMTGATLRELRAVLDDELQRLPAAYRTAIVLCHLEEKTLAQAAKILDCPAGTVSSRLSRGREMLRKGLTRRGVTLPVCGLAATLSESMASAALPSLLVQSTVQAGLLVVAGKALALGAASAKVALLAEATLKAVQISKPKLLVSILVVIGTFGAGVGTLAFCAAGSQPHGAQLESTKTKADNSQKTTLQMLTVLNRAKEAADTLEDKQWKAWLLQTIAELQVQNGDRIAAARSYLDAIQAAREITELGRVRAMQTLIWMAGSQAKSGFIQEARSTADAITEGNSHGDWRDHALALIACEQAKAGDIPGALRTAEASVSVARTAWVLKEVAIAQASAGKVNEAGQTAKAIAKPGDKAEALVAIAQAQAKRKDRDAAKKTLQEALTLANSVPREQDFGHVAAGLVAAAQAEMGELKEARLTADAITKAPWKDIALKRVAEVQAKAGDSKGALRTAHAIEAGYYQGEALKNILTAQLQSGDLEGGSQTAESIKNVFWHVVATAEIAQAQARTGDQAPTVKTFKKALAEAGAAGDKISDKEPGMEGLQSAARSRIVQAQAEAGEEQEALTWANKQPAGLLKTKALLGIAQGMAARKP